MRSTRTRGWTGRVGRLRGHLEHFSYRSLCDHQDRMQRYAALMAQALYESGKRCGLGKVLINPQWRFVRGYLLRLGFLDGWRGLVFALIEANYVRRKYLELYMLEQRRLRMQLIELLGLVAVAAHELQQAAVAHQMQRADDHEVVLLALQELLDLRHPALVAIGHERAIQRGERLVLLAQQRGEVVRHRRCARRR